MPSRHWNDTAWTVADLPWDKEILRIVPSRAAATGFYHHDSHFIDEQTEALRLRHSAKIPQLHNRLYNPDLDDTTAQALPFRVSWVSPPISVQVSSSSRPVPRRTST